jgi:hypothetical protein
MAMTITSLNFPGSTGHFPEPGFPGEDVIP